MESKSVRVIGIGGRPHAAANLLQVTNRLCCEGLLELAKKSSCSAAMDSILLLGMAAPSALLTDPLVRGSILGKSLLGVGSVTGLVGVSSTPVACKSKMMSLGRQPCWRSSAASISNNAVRLKIFSLAKLGERYTRFLDSKNSKTSLNGIVKRKEGGWVGMMSEWMTHICVTR